MCLGRTWQEFDGDLGDDTEQAFGTGNQRQQVVTGRVKSFASDFQQLAFDRDEANLHDVMHGQAIFQAMYTAGIFGDVATDRAGDLAGRVGRVVQAVHGRGF